MATFTSLGADSKRSLKRLTKREQLAVAVGIGAIAWLLADWGFLTPQRQKAQILDAQLNQSRQLLANLQSEIKAVESGTAIDPALKQLAELQDLRKEAAVIDAVLNNAQGTPIQLGSVIRRLIANQHQKIRLESIKTLPAQSLNEAAAQGRPAAQQSRPAPSGNQDIYRHGVELEISGNYFDLLAYLKSLERSSNSLFWSDLRMTTQNYPLSVLKVKIFILSNERDLNIS